MKKLETLKPDVFDFELFTELRTPTFLRTKLDVVYSDINNWDNEGILFYQNGTQKGSQKSLSYIEYVWIKIVEELKQYNFSDEEIRTYRTSLLSPINNKEFEEIVRDIVIKDEKIPSEIKKQFLKEDINDILEEIGFTQLELVIVEGIVKRQDVNVLCFRNPLEVFGLSKNTLEELYKRNEYEQFNDYLRGTHLNICLTPILRKFMSEEKIDSSKKMILSNEEYKMITEIRKRIKDIKTLKVKYKEGKIDRIDIHSMKSVKAESSLMAIIKSASYSSIEMTTEKGKIVCINHTEKIKI